MNLFCSDNFFSKYKFKFSIALPAVPLFIKLPPLCLRTYLKYYLSRKYDYFFLTDLPSNLIVKLLTPPAFSNSNPRITTPCLYWRCTCYDLCEKQFEKLNCKLFCNNKCRSISIYRSSIHSPLLPASIENSVKRISYSLQGKATIYMTLWPSQTGSTIVRSLIIWIYLTICFFPFIFSRRIRVWNFRSDFLSCRMLK